MYLQMSLKKLREQSKRNSTQLQISEPIENISYKGRDSIMTLGQDKIKDFSGESAGGPHIEIIKMLILILA